MSITCGIFFVFVFVFRFTQAVKLHLAQIGNVKHFENGNLPWTNKMKNDNNPINKSSQRKTLWLDCCCTDCF